MGKQSTTKLEVGTELTDFNAARRLSVSDEAPPPAERPPVLSRAPSMRAFLDKKSSFSQSRLNFRASSRNLLSARGPTPASALAGALNGSTAMSGFMSPRQAQQYIADFGQQALEQDKQARLSHSQDPFAFAHKPSFDIPKKLWLVIMAIPVVSWLFLYMCFGFDKASESVAGTMFNTYDLAWSLFNPDLHQGRSVVESVLNTMSVIFGLLITVIGIILQLAASRFTSHVTQLFFRDPRIGLALSYVVFCNAFVFWVYLSMGDGYVPRASVVVSLLMVISHLALLFPFLAYLFWFLDPEKVVTKIMNNGLRAAAESLNDHDGRDIDRHQVKATLAIEHLMDAASSALERKDKNITSEIVDALCSFTMLYGDYKDRMFPYWYDIPDWIRQSPDFLTLSDEAIDELKDNKTWVEWKILRQYHVLFNESLKYMKEMCYHIAMNTRLMAEAAGRRGDLHVVDLTIKFFNTYLRASINGFEVRTVYNVLFQYRQLSEWIIECGKDVRERTADIDSDNTVENDTEIRAIRIAKFMRYYAFICSTSTKVPFLVETIAQDLRVICETSFHLSSVTHAKLLDVFLTLFDGSELGGAVNQGVRRAQIILATSYLLGGRPDFAKKIHDDIASETNKELWGLMQELQNMSNREFWEVSERGTNFSYLTPEQKSQLPIFFSWFKNFLGTADNNQDPAEKKKYDRHKALFNFS